MKRERDAKALEHRSFLILWLVFLISHLVLFVVGYCLRGHLSNAVNDSAAVLLQGFIGLGVANATAAQVFFRKSLSSKPVIAKSGRSTEQTVTEQASAQKSRPPLTWYSVACVLNECIAIYGLVWSMNGGSLLTHAAFAVTAVLLHATTFPRER